jgi:hypothetical protein
VCDTIAAADVNRTHTAAIAGQGPRWLRKQHLVQILVDHFEKGLKKMSVRKSLAITAIMFGLAAGALPASAQQGCVDMYNRMMSQGPGSPQYMELFNRYTERCTGSSAPARSSGRRAGGQCEELRLACENKDRLGEQGEGNCRRYRQTCQQPPRQQMCEELRTACLQKDQLGEQGEGNCRRYRETCRR